MAKRKRRNNNHIHKTGTGTPLKNRGGGGGGNSVAPEGNKQFLLKNAHLMYNHNHSVTVKNGQTLH